MRLSFAPLCLVVCLLATLIATADPAADRKKAQTLLQQGNWKEAYEVYLPLTTDPAVPGDQTLAADYNQAMQCLQRLNDVKSIDAYREKVVAAHADDWPMLQAVAQTYMNVQHNGFMIAGEFERGNHRGGGTVMHATERDRVRALQLYADCLPLLAKETNKAAAAQVYMAYANMFTMQRGVQESWRLGYLTDLTAELPDYEEGWGYYRGGGTQGAPVDAEGNPLFHAVPESWEAATTDGERWRWLLITAMETHPQAAAGVRYQYAQFLWQQFGVQTLAQWGYGRNWGQADDGAGDTQRGILTLHTLSNNETVAKLATGVKRFELPDDYNYVAIYEALAKDKTNGYGQSALQQLASIYLNRRQYDKAADAWRRNIADYGDDKRNQWKQKQLDQIIKPWGRFEPSQPQVASEAGATAPLRFRNATSAELTVRRVKIDDLLKDVKAYLRSNPENVDWQTINVTDIGSRLMQDNQERYLEQKKTTWTVELEPRERHFDRQIDLATPITTSGVYYLEAVIADGNTARTLLWIEDTVIVQKPLSDGSWFFVADAKTGAPIVGANMEFFGYRQDYIDGAKRGTRRYNVITDNFAEKTDDLGQLIMAKNDTRNNYNWLAIARTEDGRLAYYGWQGMSWGHYYDQEYNQQKVFGITDRPVYRPDQEVKFKFWLNQAQYDKDGPSPYAGQQIQVRINDPAGEKVFEKTYKVDDFGGIDGEMMLPRDAKLGAYYLFLSNNGGGIQFRVEEYKKPEYEVTIDAPTKPVMLGEKITATITAKYFFGAPVTKATVKYKVMRQSQDSRWYPTAGWDWLYGRGYWWYCYDYAWYPGWESWGCWAPTPWWWSGPAEQPELIAEVEAEIGADGTLVVPIDTALAKEMHGNQDHAYTITAEVVDESRRTIVGSGKVLVAREPFKVYAWMDRGHYRVGDTAVATFNAQTLDNKPVAGDTTITLYKVSYATDGKPTERAVQTWETKTGTDGLAEQKISASEAGQYRIAAKVTDSEGHVIEGGYVFVVSGKGFDGREYRFNALELVPDRREYNPGDEVQLQINTAATDSTVVLFLRPSNGTYLPPKVLRLKGKSVVEAVKIIKKDMPNVFIEALTVADGRVHTQVREIVVPPEKRILNVEVLPSQQEYLPGAEATVKVKLTDHTGEPFVGSTVMSVYDKSVEYISGGSNVAEIKDFFWKWRRNHRENTQSSLMRAFYNYMKPGETGMGNLGVFGATVTSVDDNMVGAAGGEGGGGGRERRVMAKGASMEAEMSAAPMASMAMADSMDRDAGVASESMEEAPPPGGGGGTQGAPNVEPAVRQNFADTALWVGNMTTDKTGVAEMKLTMPENLTTWKIRTWAMGQGTRVGESTVEVVTTKNVIIRLQAPRFFVEKDEVVLSANVHNYLKTAKQATVVLELDGGSLEPMPGVALSQQVTIDAHGEQRIDWRVKAVREGDAVVRMKVLTDEESDAMQMRFPVKVHGIDKMVAWSGHMRPEATEAKFTFTVPEQRRVETGRLELRYSPTLAGSMVDALPYMVSYPYGCTEQTLSRFLPTAITQKVLLEMELDLAAIRDKRSNLNAQEIGDDTERAAQWARNGRSVRYDKQGNPIYVDNPVFDKETVDDMVKTGVNRLTNMQLSDGGWGWFSGYGEHSYAHTTAYVVHGLQVARDNDVAIVPGVLEQGVAWLKRYQDQQVQLLNNALLDPRPKDTPWKSRADDMDAFVYMVLVDADVANPAMLDFLYRDRTSLSVYAKCMYALALHKQKQVEKRDMLRRNVEQFLKTDAENQTAWLELGNGSYWYYWYGSEYEAHAYYLKLLAAVDPQGETAPWLVKYLLNNRKNATYWNSTRDTAICIEAFADYMRASGEDKPDMQVSVFIDGKKYKDVAINQANIFNFDNKLVLTGDAVQSGEHVVEIRKSGKGPLYMNNYVSYFSLEDDIKKAGLEVKVERKVYKLVAVDKEVKVAGSKGQALDQKVEKYDRVEVANLDTLKSGDLVEIELVIESKNDYEYILFEDFKAAGFEAVDLRSGYSNNGLGAYMELRDDRVGFFVRSLARGRHSISYRLRAEIPGKFSALPAVAQAMYAPELRGNSDEIKIQIED